MVMKRFSLSLVFWALCVFFICTPVASEYMDPTVDGEPQESSEEALQTGEDEEEDEEKDEKEAESEKGPTTPWQGVAPEVKYELDRQLEDTGLIFSPYDPGEVRPANGQYSTFPGPSAPFFFVEEEEGEEQEDDEKNKGEKKDE
jgi:hypothetical protein